MKRQKPVVSFQAFARAQCSVFVKKTTGTRDGAGYFSLPHRVCVSPFPAWVKRYHLCVNQISSLPELRPALVPPLEVWGQTVSSFVPLLPGEVWQWLWICMVTQLPTGGLLSWLWLFPDSSTVPPCSSGPGLIMVPLVLRHCVLVMTMLSPLL